MAPKRYKNAAAKVDRDKQYPLNDALTLLQSMDKAKFDESVDIAVRLGIDSKQSDQGVRGAITLPHGIGKKLRVAVFAKGEKAKEAAEAGADVVGGEDLAEKIEKGWLEFEKAIATPDMMGLVGKLGKVLGPRGMMPNPKLGTVTNDLAKAIGEIKAGRLEFRNDKAGIVHAVIGKRSFGNEQLHQNCMAFIEALQKAKPAASKGVYLVGISISGTMTPGIRVQPESVVQVEE